MMTFADFLQTRLAADGFTTEDALASFLPLAREVQEAHAAGLVAPLQGIEELRVEGVRIWFEEAKRAPVRRAGSDLQRVARDDRGAVEIVSERRVTTEIDDGSEQVLDLAVGDLDQPVTRPVYLPGYQSWEHQLGCHDPLTDIYSLGLILASLACGLDFNDSQALASFAAHRQNLFTLKPGLHPVVARVIVRMTELDRRQRAQDLSSLVRTLENYRDQEIDFDFDLARSTDFAASSKRDKQTVVLSKLRERLFEISRRNRLLHFQGNMQSVNLTHASVPLSFDIQNIRPDQILIWNDKLQREVTAGKPLSLNKYLNFTEVLYLPSQLERLIAETKRDEAEFGFAQLRLVVCFLHWANLKEKPVEQYDSPLVLLPVQLKKKKGIRDTFYLEAMATEAEINPVIRHQFKQLYEICLPESIDLATEKLDILFESLARQISQSESAVRLAKIDRPRIALIHEKARRKLDQYQRRARLAGRGIRKYLDLDYSYDPANYHPLGIKLFSAKIRPAQTHLREIVEATPRPRSFAAPDTEAPVVEQERQFYALQSGTDSNPYEWTFDLCSVTLANFRYRRMSLVRDYEALLADGATNPAFEAVFSLVPRATASEPREARSFADRFDVVTCDPTQATAIAEAEAARSYIIQGPPGTGKSQTITNLIADYVARGKRVLFVCEKRAAIDVVYARLRQCGLADLCCLIHDSQTDKKAFVLDLKRTYESLLATPDSKESPAEVRHQVVQRLLQDAAPLEQFDQVMQSTPPDLGISVRSLLDRCLELRECVPGLDALAKEKLPTPAEWLGCSAAVRRFEQALREVGGTPVLARHPLRILSPRLASAERPLELIAQSAVGAKADLDRSEEHLTRCGIPREQWEQLGRARLLMEYAGRVTLLSAVNQLALLDPTSETAKWFDGQQQRLAQVQEAIHEAEQANRFWRDKFSPAETVTALEQARGFEASVLAWLQPAWWRLRSALNRSYDFKSQKVRPRWSRVLEQLHEEYEARQRRAEQLRDAAARLTVDTSQIEALIAARENVSTWLPQQPRWIRTIHAALLKSPQSAAIITRVIKAQPPFHDAVAQLTKIADDPEELTLGQVKQSLSHIIANVDSLTDFLECLRELGSTPQTVASALRSLPITPREIEAAVAENGLERLYRQHKHVERYSSQLYQTQVQRLEQNYDRWLELNAAEIRDRVRKRFLQSIRISEQSATTLAASDKVLKQRYSRGRRELEHEFGKQMRFKAIRDLVADESGDVVNDLKPIWLMSPLSVSDTLPLATDRFDVVIFDEASQITLEEAVPALFRAPQAIIVGDEMQLPPTDFFSAKQSPEEEEDLLIESDGELVQYDLDSGSFLSHAAKNLFSTMLGWHYRSRSESLISFSNWAFYDGRLLTVPDESLATVERAPIVVAAAEDGLQGASEVLARPISYHYLAEGVYDNRRNRAEAEYIAEVVRAILKGGSRLTIGIVAFSEAQQDEIEQALTRLSQDDKEFKELLEAEIDREDDGQFVGLLVKNLENIQGDERDVIILSICYGRPPQGKMRMNFGPINKSGGEKRLNVAFSRAKRHMAVVSSVTAADITNDYNDGANCLKHYLQYAEAISTGNVSVAARVMHGLSAWAHDDTSVGVQSADVVSDQLAEVLVNAGYQVDRSVGQSHFRCDLAIYRTGDSSYRLGILVDNNSYYEQSDIVERDMMRPRLLNAFGWKVVRVFAKEWYSQPAEITKRLLAVLDGTGTLGNEGERDLEDDEATEQRPG